MKHIAKRVDEKPLLTESTYSMLMDKIDCFDIKCIHKDEISIRGTPGLKRLLFAIDHYHKPCDKVLQIACNAIWEQMDEKHSETGVDPIESLLTECLPEIVCCFEDCIRVHRILALLLEKYDRTADECAIETCLCKEQTE